MGEIRGFARRGQSQEEPMPYVAFHELCPDVASRETRTITVLPAPSSASQPRNTSSSRCSATSQGAIVAECSFRCILPRKSTSWPSSPGDGKITPSTHGGWEWTIRALIREMQGPILNLASPQSENAEALLKLAQKMLLADPVYVDRIKRHYTLFRSKIPDRVKKAKNVRGRYSNKWWRRAVTGI